MKNLLFQSKRNPEQYVEYSIMIKNLIEYFDQKFQLISDKINLLFESGMTKQKANEIKSILRQYNNAKNNIYDFICRFRIQDLENPVYESMEDNKNLLKKYMQLDKTFSLACPLEELGDNEVLNYLNKISSEQDSKIDFVAQESNIKENLSNLIQKERGILKDKYRDPSNEYSELIFVASNLGDWINDSGRLKSEIEKEKSEHQNKLEERLNRDLESALNLDGIEINVWVKISFLIGLI